jgi:serine/threonine protein kinase
MNQNHLCMGCMANKGEALQCPVCGWFEGVMPESFLHLPPRTILQGKYLIGRVLGQGGFGITYLVWDILLDRKLAIKEYFPRDLATRATGDTTVSVHSRSLEDQYSYGLDKFLDEAKTLAKFDSHPNIISVKDFFQANGTAYLVMNYLEGATLNDYLNRTEARLPYEQVLSIMLPVLDALEVIHGEGLLHRDISPDNIFITAQGLVILLDFGAARHALGSKGKNISIILKPGYAPEEQYRSGGDQGPWTDIYAVAATFYRALTGNMPPDALERLNIDILVAPSSIGVNIEPAGESALLKALALRAKDRHQTIRDFRDALVKSDNTAINRDFASSYNNKTTTYPTEQKSLLSSINIPRIFQIQKKTPAQPRSYNIGRHPSNDLVLDDRSVSRYHASIYKQEGKVIIEDRGSTHGTFVDDQMIKGPLELEALSTIAISDYKYFFDGENLFDDKSNIVYSFKPANIHFREVLIDKITEIFGLLKVTYRGIPLYLMILAVLAVLIFISALAIGL